MMPSSWQLNRSFGFHAGLHVVLEATIPGSVHVVPVRIYVDSNFDAVPNHGLLPDCEFGSAQRFDAATYQFAIRS